MFGKVDAIVTRPFRCGPPLTPADAPGTQVAEFGKGTDMCHAAQPKALPPAYVFLAPPVCSGCLRGIALPVNGSVGANQAASAIGVENAAAAAAASSRRGTPCALQS